VLLLSLRDPANGIPHTSCSEVERDGRKELVAPEGFQKLEVEFPASA